jgi:serine/threonine-protein kinase
VPDPVVSSSNDELRAHVERALSATYELEREIGRGGMGIVYRARDKRLKRPVAIKILPPELAYRSEIRSRFLREAETSAQLSHPNIVPIYSVDEQDNLVFFVMACVDGDNLAKVLHDRGPLPVKESRRMLMEVADALAYAHGRNVIHRDIKPDNILIDQDDGRAVVTDFGIARAVIEGADSRLTATGMALGTPAYMSPEQAAGDRDIDGRSDLYSLGVVAYQMLSGELPFQASSTPAMLVKHLSERPVPVEQRRPDLPPDLSRLVMRMLEKEPGSRFSSASDLVQALESGVVPNAPAGPSSYHIVGSPASTARDVPQYGTGFGSGFDSDPGVSSEQMGASLEDQRRWDVKEVKEFRRKLAPFIMINAVFVLIALFGSTDMLGITAIWSVYIAYKYAKLWADGYDWRDVFKQPRDRLFLDVAAETIDSTKAIWDHNKRDELRRRGRINARRSQPLFGDAPVNGMPTSPNGVGAPVPGPSAPLVQQAQNDLAEINHLLGTMNKQERDRIPEVGASAQALATKVGELARSLADLDRNATPGAASVIEEEIARLEAQANPLDTAASEERVRRLAYLKRQRRSITDMERRRQKLAGNLESCRVALQNMRYDLVRLRTGGETAQHVTLIAERAMALARDVDNAVYAADEIRANDGRETGRGRR